VWGPLSDRVGRRAPLVACLALFLAFTAACAFAPTIDALVGLRVTAEEEREGLDIVLHGEQVF